uniref:glutathione transferase n=1 Tax=Plectus sambesii TaxID=2011161 RepID=A0A914V8Y2_9BILA
MPAYRLCYFNFRGRAEPARFLFHLAGVPYEDVRWELADWAKIKNETPWGQGPVLEVDGKPLAQAPAINQYLAKLFGYNGKNDWEGAQIQELQGALDDVINEMKTPFMTKDEEEKERLLQQFISDKVEPFYSRLVKRLTENGNRHFVGDGLTIADIALYVWIEGVDEGVIPGVLAKFPVLEEFVKRTASLPKMREWIEKRPDCPFSIVSKKKQ